jgi:arsenite methyltransferase
MSNGHWININLTFKMNENASTKNDANTMNSASGLNRTYTAPEIALQRTRTLDALKLNKGERVLDIGCGTGFLSYEIAERVGENGNVIAFDLKQEMIDATAERCAELDQVKEFLGDVTAISQESSSFDAITCAQVLLYVSEIDTALNEIHRVLKPGGRAAILETDWQGLVIASEFPELSRTIVDAWDATVPSPNLPTRLGKLLLDHGFHSIEVQAIPLLNATYAENSFSASSLNWLSKNAYKKGVITKDQGMLWVEDLLSRAKNGNYFFCLNRFLFVGYK